MTVDEFRTRFAEFRTASNPLVELKLAEAKRRIAPEVFGELTDDAIGYLAAHLLAKSVFGKNMRLEDDKKTTGFWDEYVAIRNQVVVRSFVT